MHSVEGEFDFQLQILYVDHKKVTKINILLIRLFYMGKINKLESIQVRYQVEQDEKYLQDDDQL